MFTMRYPYLRTVEETTLTGQTGVVDEDLVPEIFELGHEHQLLRGLDGGEDEGAEDEVEEAAEGVHEEAASRSHPGGGSTVRRCRPHHRALRPQVRPSVGPQRPLSYPICGQHRLSVCLHMSTARCLLRPLHRR